MGVQNRVKKMEKGGHKHSCLTFRILPTHAAKLASSLLQFITAFPLLYTAHYFNSKQKSQPEKFSQDKIDRGMRYVFVQEYNYNVQ